MPCSRLLAALALGCCALLARAETLVAIDNANPPFMYLHDGQARGLYPAMLEAVFARLGEPLTLQAMPWKRALLKGAAGEVGIGGIYRNIERLRVFDYSEPIYEERLLLYVRRDQAFDFHGIEDLHGRRIGVIRGWSYTDDFDRAMREGRIDAQPGSSDEANLRKLASGRLDAVVVIEMAARRLLEQDGLDALQPLPRPLSINPTYLVFAKQARRQDLLLRFDQALREMREDGSLQRLIDEATAIP